MALERFFLKISNFFRHWFLHGFSRFLASLWAPFSTPFLSFWHHFPILFGTSILYWFVVGFFIDFYMIFADFLMTFSTYFRKREFYEMYVFPKEKQRFSRFDTFISLCFVDDSLMIFRHRILCGFFMIWGTILAPFSIHFRPFGYHFSILFRCWFFHDFRMPFW